MCSIKHPCLPPRAQLDRPERCKQRPRVDYHRNFQDQDRLPEPNVDRSRRLLPLRPDPDQAAHGARQAHDAVVQVDVAQRRRRHRHIARVRQELEVGGLAFPAGRRQRTLFSRPSTGGTRSALTAGSSCPRPHSRRRSGRAAAPPRAGATAGTGPRPR